MTGRGFWDSGNVCFLIRGLVTQVCSLHENSLSSTFKIYVFFLMYIILELLKYVSFLLQKQDIQGDLGGAQHLSNKMLIHPITDPPWRLLAHPEL